jgi:hypothetical protein
VNFSQFVRRSRSSNKIDRAGGFIERQFGALEKILAILQERVDEAETDEDRERAERELQKIG